MTNDNSGNVATRREFLQAGLTAGLGITLASSGQSRRVLDAHGDSLALIGNCDDCDGLAGVRLPTTRSTELHFE